MKERYYKVILKLALFPEQIIVLSQRQILRVNPCIWRFKILGTHWPCVALRDEISKLSIQRVKFTIEYIVAYDLGVIMTQLSYGVHLRSLLT